MSPSLSSRARSAKSGISGRKRKSFPFSLSVPAGSRATRLTPRRPPRRPGQTPPPLLPFFHPWRRRMKSPEGEKVAKRGFELVRWRRRQRETMDLQEKRKARLRWLRITDPSGHVRHDLHNATRLWCFDVQYASAPRAKINLVEVVSSSYSRLTPILAFLNRYAQVIQE